MQDRIREAAEREARARFGAPPAHAAHHAPPADSIRVEAEQKERARKQAEEAALEAKRHEQQEKAARDRDAAERARQHEADERERARHAQDAAEQREREEREREVQARLREEREAREMEMQRAAREHERQRAEKEHADRERAEKVRLERERFEREQREREEKERAEKERSERETERVGRVQAEREKREREDRERREREEQIRETDRARRVSRIRLPSQDVAPEAPASTAVANGESEQDIRVRVEREMRERLEAEYRAKAAGQARPLVRRQSSRGDDAPPVAQPVAPVNDTVFTAASRAFKSQAATSMASATPATSSHSFRVNAPPVAAVPSPMTSGPHPLIRARAEESPREVARLDGVTSSLFANVVAEVSNGAPSSPGDLVHGAFSPYSRNLPLGVRASDLTKAYNQARYLFCIR